MSEKVLAWHFLPSGGRLANGDRRKVRVGHTLRHKGQIVLCESGLHASVRAIDALRYAPGPWVCRVECSGEIVRGNDKLVCKQRKTLWMVDATDTLRSFARLCALDVIDKWDTPSIVRQYLEAGDESIRDAAMEAARAAASPSARAAAMEAAMVSSWAAASITMSLCLHSQTWEAARVAAMEAAREAACDAARDAAWAAASAASSAAASVAAREAARVAQNVRLEAMLLEAK